MATGHLKRSANVTHSQRQTNQLCLHLMSSGCCWADRIFLVKCLHSLTGLQQCSAFHASRHFDINDGGFTLNEHWLTFSEVLQPAQVLVSASICKICAAVLGNDYSWRLVAKQFYWQWDVLKRNLNKIFLWGQKKFRNMFFYLTFCVA